MSPSEPVARCCDLDGVTRFADRAGLYARARPRYPSAVVDALLDGAPAGPLLDVGAGTGISSALLASAGRRVIAVDPSVPMLAADRKDEWEVVAAAAEAIPIRAGSIGVVAAFNSFHWFQPEKFFAECDRVLLPGGRVALVWNDWDLRDTFTARFVELMRSCAGDYPPEDREAEVRPLYTTPLFEVEHRSAYPNHHQLADFSLLVQRMQSMTYVPRSGPVWERLKEELRPLYDRWATVDGVRHHYLTSLFIATRRH
jgi:SAM-dependent methyltransferase